jgi:hypothetical protein
MRTLTPGHWYLIFVCKNCATRQVLLPDLSNGTSRIVATYNVVCAQCGQEGSYDSDNIERYEHPSDA